MENIANFLTAAEKYGCNRGDLFQSVYLQDGQNMQAVVGGIHALGRKVRLHILLSRLEILTGEEKTNIVFHKVLPMQNVNDLKNVL